MKAILFGLLLSACQEAHHPLEIDDDGDGFSELDGDCDDTDASVVYCPVNHAAGGRMHAVMGAVFEMGCTTGSEECAEDEFPVHSVDLSQPFYIAETELTQGEYVQLTGTNPSYFNGCGLQCPVEQVSWHDAAAVANLLSEAEGLMSCFDCSEGLCVPAGSPYDCDGYRFPTEAEWSLAARCGEDFAFSGSESPDEVAWSTSNSEQTPHPVASKASNACGLYDMSGNVWEWVWDWYAVDSYEGGAETDPVGPSEGVERGIRGSSWDGGSENARISNRFWSAPDDALHIIGLRLARSIR